MMFSFKYINRPIELSAEKMSVLVIENKKLFRNVIEMFALGESDESFVFSENFNPIAFSKTGYFISDAFNIDLNNKKLLLKVNTFLEEGANAEFAAELEKITFDLITLGEKLCELTDFDCEFNYDISAADIIKLLQFKLGTEEASLAERLISFMCLMNKYLKVKVFVIPHLHLLFDEREMNLIYETISLYHINLLSLECITPINKSKFETLYIIDSDLCFIDNFG